MSGPWAVCVRTLLAHASALTHHHPCPFPSFVMSRKFGGDRFLHQPSHGMMSTPTFSRPVAAALALLLAGPLGAAEPFTNSLGLKMRPVAAGEFAMGSAVKPANWDEQPVHQVTISAPFLISETEVTAEQFRQFKPDAVLNPAYAPYAAGVSWHDAVAFCEWLSEQEGRTYRLPTEAEWEYAARAGRTDGAAWETAPDAANPWGLRNLLTGPVEWCADWFGEYGLPPATPLAPPRSSAAVTSTAATSSRRPTTCAPPTVPPRRPASDRIPAAGPTRRTTASTASVSASCSRRR